MSMGVFWLDEVLLVQKVEKTRENTAETSSEDVTGQVMSQDSLGIFWVPPSLPDCLANRNSWVKRGSSEVIDRDESPEN